MLVEEKHFPFFFVVVFLVVVGGGLVGGGEDERLLHFLQPQPRAAQEQSLATGL